MPANKKPSKFPAKIKNALLAAVIVIALYTFALFLPNLASVIALLLGVATFLVTLYFDRDSRFFRIGTLAFALLVSRHIFPYLKIEINPESILFQLKSAENAVGAYDYLLLIIAILCFVLYFLSEKASFNLSNNLTKILIWGMAFGVIALSVPSSISSNNQINIKGDNIKVESGGTVIINTGDSLDRKILEEIKQLAIENQERLKNTVNPNERRILEEKIKTLNNKLANTEKTLKEEKQLRKKTLQTIKQLKAEIPSKQLENAQKALQEKGDKKLAKQALDDIVKNGAGLVVAQAAYQSGKIAESDVDYKEAMELYNKAITLDKNNPDYLLNAGIMARTLGDYNSAQQWLERLLSIREKEGNENINLALAQHELASLYNDRGKYKAAVPLYQQSLSITKKVLGRDHANVATSLNSLAELYRVQGNYKAAEPLYQQSLSIKEKALGKDHPLVAVTLNNLALLYASQGSKVATAESLLQRSLKIREKVLGKNHPDVAISLNNLAGLYQAQGKHKEAEPLFQRSLLITEKVLGKDHPDVATTLNNLAELYQSQGKYKAAEPLYQRSLIVYEKALGKDHPAVATTLNNISGLYLTQGKYKAVEPLYQRSLKITEKALGKDHPDVATTLNNLALLYQAQDKYAEAEPLYQRAIQILEKTFPKGHPNIEAIKANYNALKQKMAKKK